MMPTVRDSMERRIYDMVSMRSVDMLACVVVTMRTYELRTTDSREARAGRADRLRIHINEYNP